MSFNLLTCPSTWPVLQGKVTAALIAASSWRTPLAKVRMKGVPQITLLLHGKIFVGLTSPYLYPML